ncbi:D-amino acid aminotransferase [Bermanella marisrubri]|uniref:Aminodeoxychorismate lyase n=1 Tax=Bermanella marisrubri TaxID=207949 RepID=Q1N2K5_9GAMM|nr:D-amino acid aminotransferase [Bermanella marisrubri]EAT12402.1 D-alanine transaminase [Oceanobacter sp. RED65] [Bermanella marisrubri]QIZ85483.1 D-amino acid aminotransferase [Bermanella marisrubri]
MSIVFLNNEFMPMEEAKISPMDRGFLFGDGIYEVIPSYDGKLVGFGPHIDRMNQGLEMIGIQFNWSHEQWQSICQQLIEKNGNGNLGLYLHVSRGADEKRFHAYPDNVEPTVYAFAFDIPAANIPDKSKVKGYRVATTQDLRWQRCNIKSTALLGNVMHFQHGHGQGYNETILFNAENNLTEGSACNAYIVKDGVVITPPLDHQLLPGITRHMLLDILRKHSDIKIEERNVSMEEVMSADEVWLTSSSKEIAPVIEIDGKPVGNGEIGDTWLAAQTLYTQHKHDY